MIPLQNKTIEESAVLFFLDKENTAKAFQVHLETTGLSVTIQGVYKALNKLIREGVLVKNRMKLIVSREWVNNLIQTLGGDKALDIKEGESASYKFNTLSHLDAYWKHIIGLIGNEFKGFPVFSYEPHEIWVYLKDREKSQEEFLQSFEKNSLQGFFRLGGTTFGDKEYKRRFGNEFLQVDTSDKKVLKDYILVIGEYVITTKLMKTVTEKIEEVFLTKNSLEEIKNGLDPILSKKQRVTLSIERNKEKAKKLRKKIAENFYIPQELIKKYTLF